MITTQAYNALLSKVRELTERVERAESGINPSAAFGVGDQTLHVCKIATVNGDTPATYQVRVLAGAGQKDPPWLVNRVMSSDPTVTFAVDDYAVLILNNSGVNYLISSGSGSDTALLTRHSHQGYYDGGWAGFYSGDI